MQFRNIKPSTATRFVYGNVRYLHLQKHIYIYIYTRMYVQNLFTVEHILRFVRNHLRIYDFDVRVTVRLDKFL